MKKKKEGRKENEMKWIDNGIGDEGAKSLSETLNMNTSLTSLNLGCDENEKKWNKRYKRNEKWNEMNR